MKKQYIIYLLLFISHLLIVNIIADENFRNTEMLDRKNYPSIDLCYICDGSLNTTFGLFPNIKSEDFDFEQDVMENKRRACWKHGIHDLFCLPAPKPPNMKIGSETFENDPEEECKTFISIMPPLKTTESCKVNILDNHGKLEDVLIINKNGSIAATNRSWYALPKTQKKDLKYTLVKRIPSKKDFEGKLQ